MADYAEEQKRLIVPTLDLRCMAIPIHVGVGPHQGAKRRGSAMGWCVEIPSPLFGVGFESAWPITPKSKSG
ncbi:hypothetical protein GCM10023333_08250 [Ferrimonas pelagia]|uniref:Uncharacterized protein n=1 Tax=Ferrimonas pelagia TaxID=1177826 RepID=A0ABP9EGS7_9GAMM